MNHMSDLIVLFVGMVIVALLCLVAGFLLGEMSIAYECREDSIFARDGRVYSCVVLEDMNYGS